MSPYGTVGGNTVHARVLKVGEPAVSEERVWSAYEKGRCGEGKLTGAL